MGSLIGRFILAKVPFAEGDGRYKVRPCLVISQKKMGNDTVYLVAPKFSAIEKCKGGNEVAMTAEEAVAVGMDKEGVLRFNREHLCAILEKDVLKVFGSVSNLPELKRQALVNAARRIGCAI